MRLSILAVGQIGRQDEAALFDTYAKRSAQAGRHIGFDALHVHELKEQSGAHDKLAAYLDERSSALIVALDEGGKNMTSRQFATRLGQWRDEGRRETIFLIGGADGLNDALRQRADMVLSLGALTWPHMLARVLLAEQLYRAISILSGHPYHRD